MHGRQVVHGSCVTAFGQCCELFLGTYVTTPLVSGFRPTEISWTNRWGGRSQGLYRTSQHEKGEFKKMSVNHGWLQYVVMEQQTNQIYLLSIIVLACISIGSFSVFAAAFAAFRFKPIVLERMVSFSIGLMLATSLIHAVPEAVVSKADLNALMFTLLGSILGFFLLQKFALLRHNHHHEHDGHHHRHGHDKHMAGSGGWLIVLGGSFHNFTDGVVIAAAFIADVRLGVVTSLAIAAHEVPHKLGDFVILLNAGFSKGRALLIDLLGSATIVLGGAMGWWFLGSSQEIVPYALMVAAGSFIYISMSDLIPYVQHQSRVRDVIPQVSLIAAGVAVVWAMHGLAHMH
jgi:zinc and cadmium transporter